MYQTGIRHDDHMSVKQMQFLRFGGKQPAFGRRVQASASTSVAAFPPLHRSSLVALPKWSASRWPTEISCPALRASFEYSSIFCSSMRALGP
jgi:hypothetical protein